MLNSTELVLDQEKLDFGSKNLKSQIVLANTTWGLKLVCVGSDFRCFSGGSGGGGRGGFVYQKGGARGKGPGEGSTFFLLGSNFFRSRIILINMIWKRIVSNWMGFSRFQCISMNFNDCHRFSIFYEFQ